MFFDLSEIFKDLRKEKGVTQSELATIGGVSLATQQNYEAQRTKPSIDYLQKLASAGFDVNYLLTGQRRAEMLSAEDTEILALWHKAPLLVRHAALNVLATGQSQETANHIGDITGTFITGGIRQGNKGED